MYIYFKTLHFIVLVSNPLLIFNACLVCAYKMTLLQLLLLLIVLYMHVEFP